MEIVKGRVRKFGDNVDTDAITPGAWLHLPTEQLVSHAFEPILQDFYKSVRDGDIIVAGNNFGCGSSREQATAVVGQLGIRFIVCESMARIYFRNCVALGIHPIMAKGASSLFNEGDTIEIDLDKGEVRNPKTDERTLFEPLSDTPRQILEAGGIFAFLKKEPVSGIGHDVS